MATPGTVGRVLHFHPLEDERNVLRITKITEDFSLTLDDGVNSFDTCLSSLIGKAFLRVNGERHVVGAVEQRGSLIINGVEHFSAKQQKAKKERYPFLDLQAGTLILLTSKSFKREFGRIKLKRIAAVLGKDEVPPAPSSLVPVKLRTDIEEPIFAAPKVWSLSGNVILPWKMREKGRNRFCFLQVLRVEKNNEDVVEWIASDSVYYVTITITKSSEGKFIPWNEISPLSIVYSNVTENWRPRGSEDHLFLRVVAKLEQVVGKPVNVEPVARRKQRVANIARNEEEAAKNGPVKLDYEGTDLPPHVRNMIEDSKSWCKTNHAYGIGTTTARDILGIFKGSEHFVRQFCISAIHQGSLYSATAKSVDVFAEALEYVSKEAATLVGDCLMLISSSSFSDSHTFSIGTPLFDWEVPRSPFAGLPNNTGQFSVIPKDLFQHMIGFFDDASLVAFSDTCRYASLITFDLRKERDEFWDGFHKDPVLACSNRLIENFGKFKAYLRRHPDNSGLWYVLRARDSDLLPLAQESMKNAHLSLPSRAAAALYVGANRSYPLDSNLPLIVRVAYAYARFSVLCGNDDDFAILKDAWINNKEELLQCENDHHFLREHFTYTHQMAFARVICLNGERYVRLYLPLLERADKLDSNINNIISDPIEAAFKETKKQPVESLTDYQADVLQAVISYLERTEANKFAWKAVAEPVGLPSEMEDAKQLLKRE